MQKIEKNSQYYKFAAYGFLKNLRFYEAFLILFFLEKGIDYLKIGLLYSIREITIMLFEIPSGLVADVLGRKKTLIASFFVYILSFATFYFSNHFGLMVLAMVLFALADAFRSGVHKAMIFQYLTRHNRTGQKTDYYGHTRSWSQTGSAIASLIAGAMVFYYGSYRIIFAVSAVPYFLDMLLIWSYPGYLDGEFDTKNKKSVGEKFAEVWKTIVMSLKEFSLLRILSSLSLHTGYYKAVKDYIQPVMVSLAITLPWLPLLREKQKSALVIGVIYFFLYLLTAQTSRSSGRFLKKFTHFSRPMNLTMVTGILLGFAAGIFYLLHWYILSILGFVLIMLNENLRKPIGIAFVTGTSNDKAAASVLSIQSQAQSFVAAIMAFVIGWGAQLGGPGTGIIFGSGLLLLLLPFSLLKRAKS
jgi:MFS family permease